MHLFDSILSTTSSIALQISLIMGISLVLGYLLAMTYKHKSSYSKEFVITLTLMPTLIAFIIFLVNGSLGTSLAVAGTFSLIRFRSASGSSKEMLAVLLAMAIGLATGTGYLGLASLLTLIICGAMLLFETVNYGQTDHRRRHILLTVPLDFDYQHFFKKVFKAACKEEEILSISYKKKKQALVLEYSLVLESSISDQVLTKSIVEANPLNFIVNKQAPKKKYL
ncbi:DUF4956 domain-containing protein [Streptococcus suis]